MAWNSEELKEILRDLGPVATLWLLAIIEKNIGKGKAHNYTVFPGKIKSTAKSYDMDPPQDDVISEAFKRLKRVPLRTPDGSEDSIILGDKQEYVKLTDHGLTLATLIDNDPEVQNFIEEYLGEEEQEIADWFPAQNPGNAPITLLATSERPSECSQRYEVEAVAKFACPHPDCGGEVENNYSFTHPDETWSQEITTVCPECEQEWEYIAGDAFTEPTRSEP